MALTEASAGQFIEKWNRTIFAVASFAVIAAIQWGSLKSELARTREDVRSLITKVETLQSDQASIDRRLSRLEGAIELQNLQSKIRSDASTNRGGSQ